MSDKVRFRAEPGTRLVTAVGEDARAVEWEFDEHGILEFDVEDQEPVAAIRATWVGEGKPVTEEPADLSNLTVDELRELLEGRGLPTDGKKADLIERVQSSGTEVAADGAVIATDEDAAGMTGGEG